MSLPKIKLTPRWNGHLFYLTLRSYSSAEVAQFESCAVDAQPSTVIGRGNVPVAYSPVTFTAAGTAVGLPDNDIYLSQRRKDAEIPHSLRLRPGDYGIVETTNYLPPNHLTIIG